MKEKNKSTFNENQQLSNNQELDHLRMLIMREILKLDDLDVLEDILAYMQRLMLPENSPLSAQEPQVSYGIKANDVRVHIMRESIQMEDNLVLMDALDYVNIYVHPERRPPCQYTLEELEEVLRQSEEDIKAGRVIAHDDIPKLYPQWFQE